MSAMNASRRTLLVGAAALAGVAVVPAVSATFQNPDAELLRLGAAFEQAWSVQRQAETAASGRGLGDDHPAWVKADALDDATGEIVDRMRRQRRPR